MSPTGSVGSALLKIPGTSTRRLSGLVGDLDELTQAIQEISVDRARGDERRSEVVRKIDEADKLVRELRKTLK